MKANWFVALPVSADSWLDPLTASLPQSCRAFAASDLHITLAFLGAMPADRIPGIEALVQQIKSQSISASFSSFLALPSSKRLSAMTLGLDRGHDSVAALMRQHRDELIAAAGARPDQREPLPHMTFARPIRKYGSQARQDALAWMTQAPMPKAELILDRVALYTWSDQRPKVQFRKVFEKRLDA